MRRLATGTFILFYAALAVFLTVDRTFTWAAAHAESSTHIGTMSSLSKTSS